MRLVALVHLPTNMRSSTGTRPLQVSATARAFAQKFAPCMPLYRLRVAALASPVAACAAFFLHPAYPVGAVPVAVMASWAAIPVLRVLLTVLGNSAAPSLFLRLSVCLALLLLLPFVSAGKFGATQASSASTSATTAAVAAALLSAVPVVLGALSSSANSGSGGAAPRSGEKRRRGDGAGGDGTPQ